MHELKESPLGGKKEAPAAESKGATSVGERSIATAEAEGAATRWEGAGVAAHSAAVLREAVAAKTNVERPLSASTATGSEVIVTNVLPPSTAVFPA
jgi:hypothetical protein